MNLDPGESAEVQVPMPDSWPVTLTVAWTGRRGHVVPADGVIVWTAIPRPLHRRVWSFITGRYSQDYVGWPA